MHELPVTENILDITLSHARKAKARRIVTVNLVIGDLAGLVAESIQFHFDLLSKDTEAEGATLHIERVPARARCRGCRGEFTPDASRWLCPHCGDLAEEILGGREFYVESIEVE